MTRGGSFDHEKGDGPWIDQDASRRGNASHSLLASGLEMVIHSTWALALKKRETPVS
jgi:hypothetical protein